MSPFCTAATAAEHPGPDASEVVEGRPDTPPNAPPGRGRLGSVGLAFLRQAFGDARRVEGRSYRWQVATKQNETTQQLGP
eukprot:3542077-Pyramimonas_sp.AAC.1